MISKDESEQIEKHFENEMPKDIKRLTGLANYDLYYGPVYTRDLEEEDAKLWPGFVSAVKQIREWWNKQDHHVYIDSWSGIPIFGRIKESDYFSPCYDCTENEVEECEHISWEDLPSEIEYRYLCDIVFGKELATHIR